jgi:axial budding pattern protein 2
LKLSGTTPDKYLTGTISPLSIPITIASTDTSNTMTLTTWLSMDILPYLFTAFTLPNTTATPGNTFSFDLSTYLVNKTATLNATVTPSEAASWLLFNPNNMSLSGTAPKSPSYSSVAVTFHASQGGYSATSDLKVLMAGVTATSSSTGTAAVATGSSDTPSSHGLSKGAIIGIAVGLGLVSLILLLLLFRCCRRRKQRRAEERDNDADSFVAGSPSQANDPFRKSDMLNPPRNILGEIAKFSPFSARTSDLNNTRPTSLHTSDTAVEQPHRIDGLKGILEWSEKPSEFNTPKLDNGSSSFLGHGDVIGVNDPINRPSQDASSFTQTFDSSEASRASWESRQSFRWSSAENEGEDMENNRLSAAPSIPRPRQNFTPRYPRNNSPTALARLTSGRDLEDSPEFSEFEEDGRTPDSLEDGSDFVSRSLTDSSLPAGPSGLSRYGDSQGFRTDDDEGETTDFEGPVVVAMAERQSFETRRPSTNRPEPKLRPSKEKITSPISSDTKRSSRALTDEQNGAFNDAEDERNSTYAPSTAYDPNEVQGLGYPSSAIYFSSPNPDESRFSNGASTLMSEGRAPTIQAIPSNDHQHPLSPPLPQVGSFIRPRPASATPRPPAGPGEGRVTAMANETFSIHPPIHPPPTVSLSAATWSSNPPSTYRAVAEGGMPAWLHFDARELELWGVPGLANSGEVTVIRIIETLPKDKRRSDPMQFGYEPPQEREVGKVFLE